MKWWRMKKRDAELERELLSDLELEEEEQRENGFSAEDARYAAKRAFGNTALIRRTRPGAGLPSNAYGSTSDTHSGSCLGIPASLQFASSRWRSELAPPLLSSALSIRC